MRLKVAVGIRFSRKARLPPLAIPKTPLGPKTVSGSQETFCSNIYVTNYIFETNGASKLVHIIGAYHWCIPLVCDAILCAEYLVAIFGGPSRERGRGCCRSAPPSAAVGRGVIAAISLPSLAFPATMTVPPS